MRALVLTALIAASATPAYAETAVVQWPTWLRAAPIEHARVLDEMQAGQTVTTLGCNDGWCGVQAGRTVAYLPARMLAPTAPAGLAPRPGDCVQAPRFTPEGPIGTRFCPAAR